MNQGISKEVLSNLGNTNCIKQITNLSSNNDMMKNIVDFCYDSTILEGEQWKGIKDKVSKYYTLLSKRSAVASSLSGAISDAIKLLLDYLGDDSYLTPDVLEELEFNRKLAVDTIASLRCKINATYVDEKTDDDGNVTRVTKNVYTSSEISEFSAQITALEETITELDRLIDKVRGLPAVYEEAKGIIYEELANIQSFNGEVNSITPSKTVTMV